MGRFHLRLRAWVWTFEFKFPFINWIQPEFPSRALALHDQSVVSWISEGARRCRNHLFPLKYPNRPPATECQLDSSEPVEVSVVALCLTHVINWLTVHSSTQVTNDCQSCCSDWHSQVYKTQSPALTAGDVFCSWINLWFDRWWQNGFIWLNLSLKCTIMSLNQTNLCYNTNKSNYFLCTCPLLCLICPSIWNLSTTVSVDICHQLCSYL